MQEYIQSIENYKLNEIGDLKSAKPFPWKFIKKKSDNDAGIYNYSGQSPNEKYAIHFIEDEKKRIILI